MNRKAFGGSAAAAAARPVEQCIALIDYDALNADEISFRAGDVINVTGKGSASGFWEGYVAVSSLPAMATVEVGSDNEREGSSSSNLAAHPPQALHGLFPNCLVTSNMRFKMTMSNYIFQNIALCLYTYDARGDGEMSFGPGDVITAVRPSASPGWWYGVKSPGPAWTAPTAAAGASASASKQASPRFADPSASAGKEQVNASTTPGAVEERKNAPSSSSSATEGSPRELLFPTNFVTCDVVLITFNFVGRQAHELSCRNGDVVQVHRRWNDGWWEGSLRERRGIFPSNYSVPNICTTAPPLFCARCRSVFGSNTFQTSCATCAAEAYVEDVMLQSLEAYVKGEVPNYDLFAGIDIGPLAENERDGVDGEDETVNGETAEDKAKRAVQGATEGVEAAAPTGSSTALEKAGKATGNGTSCRTAVTGASTAAAAAGSSVGSGARSEGDESVRANPSRPRPRVTLLTEKDVADLASNRVKLME